MLNFIIEFFNNSIENRNLDSIGFRLEMISNFTCKEFSKDLPCRKNFGLLPIIGGL
ncbi:hypothetical protein LEP1GSC188_0032 [Leptospira weilii serovar Topaz str. LT2116]|uniref:Uncharacterized protein n=1 Tax=Leptospira weilii serovar Topaz str. LT2116 TaxID=1088540 RepID=M3G0I2_9LEPT|nr:hypothetical protein LEP1GSC188_0032 [Leptospira weilii serovar Topaz str. LT2116]